MDMAPKFTALYIITVQTLDYNNRYNLCMLSLHQGGKNSELLNYAAIGTTQKFSTLVGFLIALIYATTLLDSFITLL